jgi:hypothetical protein
VQKNEEQTMKLFFFYISLLLSTNLIPHTLYEQQIIEEVQKALAKKDGVAVTLNISNAQDAPANNATKVEQNQLDAHQNGKITVIIVEKPAAPPGMLNFFGAAVYALSLIIRN